MIKYSNYTHILNISCKDNKLYRVIKQHLTMQPIGKVNTNITWTFISDDTYVTKITDNKDSAVYIHTKKQLFDFNGVSFIITSLNPLIVVNL